MKKSLGSSSKKKVKKEIENTGTMVVSGKGRSPERAVSTKEWNMCIKPVAKEFHKRGLSIYSLIIFLQEQGYSTSYMNYEILSKKLKQWRLKLPEKASKDAENKIVPLDRLEIGGKMYYSGKLKIRAFDLYLRGESLDEVSRLLNIPFEAVKLWSLSTDPPWEKQRDNLNLSSLDEVKLKMKHELSEWYANSMRKSLYVLQTQEDITSRLVTLVESLVSKMEDEFKNMEILEEDYLDKVVSRVVFLNNKLKDAQKSEIEIKKNILHTMEKIDRKPANLTKNFKNHEALLHYVNAKYDKLKSDIMK